MGIKRGYHEMRAEALESDRVLYTSIFMESPEAPRRILTTDADHAFTRVIDAFNSIYYSQIAHHIGHGAVAPSVKRESAVEELEAARDRYVQDVTHGATYGLNHERVAQVRNKLGPDPQRAAEFYDPLIDFYRSHPA